MKEAPFLTGEHGKKVGNGEKWRCDFPIPFDGKSGIAKSGDATFFLSRTNDSIRNQKRIS